MYPSVAGLEPWSTDDSVELTDSLFHYTSTAGLQGIIEDKTLRATLASLMNDRSETTEGESIVRREIGNACRNDEELFSELRGISRDYVEDDYFISCFSEIGDGSSMWTGYGQDGYAICFNRTKIETGIDYGQGALLKVSYDESQFVGRVQRSITDYLYWSEEDASSIVNPGLLRAGLKHHE